MTSPYRHPKTGIFWLRKRVPAGLVARIGKREVKCSLGTRDAAEAKVRAAAKLVELDTRWRNLAKGVQSLSEREANFLAEDVAERFFDIHSENPSLQKEWDKKLGPTLWEEERIDLNNLSEILGKVPDQDFIRRSEMRRMCAETTKALAIRKGLITDDNSFNVLKEAVSRAFQRASLQLSEGENYAIRSYRNNLPFYKNENESNRPKPVSLFALYDGWALEARATQRTMDSFKRCILEFISHLGHDRAHDVTMRDVVYWKTAMLSVGLRAKTIKDGKLAPIKAIFQWGVRNGVLMVNPASGVSLDAKNKPGEQRRGFTDSEANKILSDALKQTNSSKWIPILTATTGARISEISQLRRKDFYSKDDVLCINIAPDAGSVKNRQSVREIPVHSSLVELGILDFLDKKGDEEPLFDDIKPDRYGSRGGTATRKISRKVRAMGIGDLQVSPNHGWRHRFLTLMRRYKVDEHARNKLSGHVQRDVAASYGEFEISYLQGELEKIPRESFGLPPKI